MTTVNAEKLLKQAEMLLGLNDAICAYNASAKSPLDKLSFVNLLQDAVSPQASTAPSMLFGKVSGVDSNGPSPAV